MLRRLALRLSIHSEGSLFHVDRSFERAVENLDKGIWNK